MLGISNLRYHRFLITLFRSLVTGSDDSGWYHMTGESNRLPHCCYCPAHSQLSLALPCIKWDWLLSCLIEWHTSSNMKSVWCFRKCVYFIKNKIIGFLRFFVFLLLVFNKLMDSNRRLTLNVGSDLMLCIVRATVQYTQVSPPASWTVSVYYTQHLHVSATSWPSSGSYKFPRRLYVLLYTLHMSSKLPGDGQDVWYIDCTGLTNL
jgi:hypothetical protein